MKIVAVVVTYNRLTLLQECIESLRRQSRTPDQILVINNGSTDDTLNWLTQQQDVITITQPNGGGSAGFYRGIKEAYFLDTDWIWLLDDDTIPTASALENLINKTDLLPGNESFGFLCSLVVWTDGNIHMKNRPPRLKNTDWSLPKGMHPVRSGTFVSLLLSAEALSSAGLPIKEFFIWFDDVEFTERLSLKGWKGALVEDSVVVHKTPDNLPNGIFDDDAKARWKYYYGTRNRLYMRKQRKGTFLYGMYVLKNLVWMPVLLALKRKDHRWDFTKTIWKGTIDSLFFHPRKEMLPANKTSVQSGKD